MNKHTERYLAEAATMLRNMESTAVANETDINEFVMNCSAAILLSAGEDIREPMRFDFMAWNALWCEMRNRSTRLTQSVRGRYREHLVRFQAVVDGFAAGSVEPRSAIVACRGFYDYLDRILHEPIVTRRENPGPRAGPRA